MNRKEARAARKAAEATQAENTAFEGTLEVGVSEEERETETGDAVESTGLVEETAEVEGEAPAKADPNAESKAKAEANRKAKAARVEKELLEKYPHVVAITQRGPNGPTRVKIRCTDPQTKQVGDQAVSVCEKEREIAVQDLFQVTRCVACQDRVIRKARRTRQSKKNKELRKFARDMKGGL